MRTAPPARSRHQAAERPERIDRLAAMPASLVRALCDVPSAKRARTDRDPQGVECVSAQNARRERRPRKHNATIRRRERRPGAHRFPDGPRVARVRPNATRLRSIRAMLRYRREAHRAPAPPAVARPDDGAPRLAIDGALATRLQGTLQRVGSARRSIRYSA